jgi:hypothetical protein
MSNTARRPQPIPDFVSNGILHDQDFPRVNTKSRFLEYQFYCIMQAPDVFFYRRTGNPARERCAPIRILRMKFVEIVSADSQLNLACALGEAGMIREVIKNQPLRQRKS